MFVPPAFLNNNSYEEILQRLIDRLPDDIDVSEGSDHYNDLAAIAWELSLANNFTLPETIKTIFPQFSYGYDQIADYHAESHGLTRKPASKATGTLRLSGTNGKMIYAGSVFSTVAVNGQESVQFITTENILLTAAGVSVNIEAQTGGTKGNVASNTIILAVSLVAGDSSATVSDLTTITNQTALTGGTDIESTEALLNRLIENERTKKYSFCGSVSDYKRWALEVVGVGDCTVIPATDDSGTVTLVLVDSAGNPASPLLCSEVSNHIMHPENPDLRLSPINASLEVQPPDICYITLFAPVKLEVGVDITTVKAELLISMRKYLSTVSTDIRVESETPEIKYYKVLGLLADTEGIHDSFNIAMGSFRSTDWALVSTWVANTNYTVGNRVHSNNKVFVCVQNGTSGNTPLNGSGTGIVDGSAMWDYIKPLSVPPYWNYGQTYSVDDLVRFYNPSPVAYYICIHDHTSDSGTENIPLLKTELGVVNLTSLRLPEVL